MTRGEKSFNCEMFFPPLKEPTALNGVLQSLRLQGSHLSENIGLQSFRIAFLLRLLSLRQSVQIQLLGGTRISPISTIFLNGLFDL